MNNYNFYMQHFPVGGVAQTIKNLETDFTGLLYSKLSGIDKYGKPQIYTEKYAESSALRVFIPDVITRDNPTLELTLFFTGETRRAVYHSFVSYITGKKITYWDNCRNRKVDILLLEAVEPSDDKLYGSIPYIECTFRFTNLSGESRTV